MVTIVAVGCTLGALCMWFGICWADVGRDLDRELARCRDEQPCTPC